MRTWSNSYHPVPILLAAVCLAVVLAAQPAGDSLAGMPRQEVPDRLKVLFLGDDGHHRPAQRARQILPYMAERGIFITYTDRLEDLNPETLGRFDVLLMYANHTHLAPEQERALLHFVAEGGGFVPVHAASACFGNSEAFIRLVGGAFKSHGTGTFRTKVLQPDHPALQGVPDFESWDETYVHMKHNPDKVVLSVRVEGAHEEPWTWVRTHGDGRVFYTAWGHDERTWTNPGFHRLLEQGIRWAAGDWALTADLAPPALAYREGTLPYYPPGVGWGVTGEPIKEVQEPLRPEASMAQTAVEPGFRMEVFAADPDIVNPIDLTWDEQGRLWIVETVDYPNRFTPEGQGNDRVKILEDTDGDGRADRVTVFAEGLNIPTSLVLAQGGVIVAQAPDMLMLKDTDGDDRADVKEVLFTGWGTFDTHAGPSNLRYGPDNHIWGVLGYSGFDGAAGGDSLKFTQGFYRFRPDGSALEYMGTTNNNTWGLGFSEEGLVFASTANGNPSVYLAVPHRYYDGVRGWERKVLGTIADTAAFSPITDRVRQVDWHGMYTSAAGHELYTARRFPKAYWNRVAFVGGPTGHLLGKFIVEPDGSGYAAHNAWNMVASRDEWFAPIQAKVGPDGALWVIDWYNLIIQHNPTPEGYETGEGNAYETELRDRQHSRIYRIVYEGADPAGAPPLGDARPEELVRALRDDNMLWRLTAQRLLVERGNPDVLPHLYELVRDERMDEIGLNVGAMHALWTMHGLGVLDGSNGEALAAATDALHHPAAGVRRAALMVLPRSEAVLEAVLGAGLLPDPPGPEETGYTVPVAAMQEAEAGVRLAALLALAEMPASRKAGQAVAELLRAEANANDPWIRDAAVAAGARHDLGFLPHVLQVDVHEGADSTYIANVRGVIHQVARHYAMGQPANDTLLETISALEAAAPAFAEAFLEGLTAGWPEGQAPSFSAAERDRLRALRSRMPAAQVEHLQKLTAQWGASDL